VTRATKADKARLLNVAYRLLDRQTSVAEAARHLADACALSRRQAYRYLQEAATLRAPVPAVAPTVAITLKLPVHTVRALRAQARRRGLTIGQIVTEALAALLGSGRRRRG
jgi:predicted DNA-binding transcriptional regulator YafY